MSLPSALASPAWMVNKEDGSTPVVYDRWSDLIGQHPVAGEACAVPDAFETLIAWFETDGQAIAAWRCAKFWVIETRALGKSWARERVGIMGSVGGRDSTRAFLRGTWSGYFSRDARAARSSERGVLDDGRAGHHRISGA